MPAAKPAELTVKRGPGDMLWLAHNGEFVGNIVSLDDGEWLVRVAVRQCHFVDPVPGCAETGRTIIANEGETTEEARQREYFRNLIDDPR